TLSLLMTTQVLASEYCTSGDYQGYGLDKLCVFEGTLFDFELTKGKSYARVFFKNGKIVTLTALKVAYERHEPNISILTEARVEGTHSSFIIDVKYEQDIDSQMLVSSLRSSSKELKFY